MTASVSKLRMFVSTPTPEVAAETVTVSASEPVVATLTDALGGSLLAALSDSLSAGCTDRLASVCHSLPTPTPRPAPSRDLRSFPRTSFFPSGLVLALEGGRAV